MKNKIIDSVYNAIEHYVNAGDFKVDCMCLDNDGNIYMTIDGKDYVLNIKEYKLWAK